STGTITNRFWDFGDGSTSNTALTTLSHVYANAGTNSVALTVSGPVGTNTQLRSNYISVTNLPPQLTLNPLNFDFGSVITGQTNVQTFQVINSGGTTLNGSASAPAPFGIKSGTPYTIAAGQTGLVTVSFSPVSAGNFSNAVVFLSNGGNSTNSVTGIGLTPPQLAVSPANLNFGTIAVNSASQATFVVTNLGGAALTNGTASVSSGPFSIFSGTPFTLAGFASTNVVIRFAPGSVGSFSNAVVLSTSNAGNSTNPVT